jgi:hypothetical protein
MNKHRSLFGIACRGAAFSFLMAATALIARAQQSTSIASTTQAPVLLASESAPADLTLANSSSSSSSSADSDAATESSFKMLDSTQPPPRRGYGRPHYGNSNTNADGSNKYTGLAGMGLAAPVGNTHKYETPSYDFQVGFGRNFSKSAALIFQFDYDHFGLQGATLQNQTTLYDTGCLSSDISSGACGVSALDGNNHVWSFTLNPTFTLPTEGSLGAYVVFGVGYYHKVTNFTEPGTGYYYDYNYGYVPYTANQVIDHYTSNSIGVNGGIGFTYKVSKFSNERFYVEARYVYLPNSQRYGVTANSSTAILNTYTGSNLYPQNSNRTTYIPVKVGLRF